MVQAPYTREQGTPLDLQDLGRFVRAGWVYVVIGALLGLLASAAYTATQRPQYEATARVLVGTGSTADVDTLNGGVTFNQQIVSTYTAVITDPLVLNPVIERLRLGTTADELADHVTAAVPEGTLLIDITVTDSSARDAARIANAITSTLPTAVRQITPTPRTGAATVRITTTRQAVTPEKAVSPDPAVDTALGLLAGLVIGLLVAFVRVAADTKLRSGSDAQRVVDAPLLASIGVASRSEQSHLIDSRDSGSPRGEAYRLLRTNLQFLDTTPGSHAFVVTSPLQGEGKTTTVSNLAVALASMGRPVVLVDADLRRPRLHEVFGIDGGVGLTDVLIGRVPLDDALQTVGADGLHVLPAGIAAPNPSELLQSGAMTDLLEELQKRYDTVLLDTPPVVPVADAAILAARTNGAILVVAENRTRRPDLQKAGERLAQVQARLLGVVVNFDRQAPTSGYGYAAKTGSRSTSSAAVPTRIPPPPGQPLTRPDLGEAR